MAETLAGRAVYLHLWPLARWEIGAWARAWGEVLARPFAEWREAILDLEGPGRELLEEALAQGVFPVPALRLRGWAERASWFHLQTYLERDLREIRAVENLLDLGRLLEALALRSGSLLNRSGLARELGLSQPTVHRSLNLLETGFLLRLPAYARSRTKRLIKAPKPYLPDPALALYLS